MKNALLSEATSASLERKPWIAAVTVVTAIVAAVVFYEKTAMTVSIKSGSAP